MVWKNVSTKPRVLISAFALFLATTTASATTIESTEQAVSREVAMVLVEEYRELRRLCAEQTGDQRRSCFHELHATNSDYRAARQQLNLVSTEDPHNIHLVSF